MSCQFLKQDNSQCGANPMVGLTYCFRHNPDLKEAQRIAVLKGGLSPKPRKNAEPLGQLTIKGVDDVLGLIEDTINRIRTEPITHQKANSIGYLANVILKAIEVDRLEKKIDLLNSILRGREINQ